MTMSLQGKALITGASSGIGAIYADRLARRGYDLILVSRTKRRLDELASRIGDTTSRQVDIIVADLGSREELGQVESVLRTDPAINLLVNNAGVGATAPLVNSDVNKMEALINLNVVALTRLTYAAVPGFVLRRAGAIINIASVVGIAPELLNGVYGGSKAFVIAFSQSLDKELKGDNIRVQAVLPGATATNFWDTAGTPLEHVPSEIVMPAEEMVDAALAGFDQGELITIPSLPEQEDWTAYEGARQNLLPNLSRNVSADRYKNVIT